jgi:IS5 family transposase
MTSIASDTMKQQTLSGFEKHGKVTRRAQFLADMERIMPWKELAAAIEPVYPKGGGTAGGRPPVPLERLLRIYFLQLWFNLSDPAVEEALYDSASMRNFVGVDLSSEAAPDETTICKFRHLLERNGLGKTLLKATNQYLKENGMKIGHGTIVDATIIGAPSSTKNKDEKRDPEMHQTAKGRQWYFGMKMHVGVDSRTRMVHTVKVSAANVADRDALPYLLHGKETRVWGDQGYQGQGAVIRQAAPKAKDFTNRRYRFHGQVNEAEKARNRTKSQVRAKVEHVFGVIKNIFGFRKVRYRGLAKNLHHVEVMAALSNIYLVRRRLLA